MIANRMLRDAADRLASRVVMMVWDGMRPDLVGPELTPNLAGLAEQGVWFDASHAVFPTVTRVNSASLSTGMLPTGHGLPGNMLYAPLVDRAAPISLGDAENVAALRRQYEVFSSPTVADAVSERGGRSVVVSTGTRGSALMCHPNLRERCDLILHPTLSTSQELQVPTERLGPLPPAGAPNTAQNRWFARAVAEYVLPELAPELLVIWHNDPDKSQHLFGFGHPTSLGAIRDADEHLGLILRALERLGLGDETAMIVVSDHGYASVRGSVDLTAELIAAGLKDGPDSTDVVVAPNGMSALLYVSDDSGHTEQIVDQIHGSGQAAVIFSGARGDRPLDGTFSLASIGVDGPLAPDLLVALAWGDDANEHGLAGVSLEHGKTNRGSHGGLSPWEVRNTLILAGAGIRRGVRSAVPAGNVDVAPTLRRLLGLSVPPNLDGRVLEEALASGPNRELTVTHRTDRIEHRGTRTELAWSTVAGRAYLDYGRRI